MSVLSNCWIFFLCIILLILHTFPVNADQINQSSTLYQASSYALVESGNYSEVVTVNDLKKYGTFGIGGYEHLDGELSQLDDNVWQIRSDGTVAQPSGDTGVCFANTIRFEPSIFYSLNTTMENKEFLAIVNPHLPDP